MPAVDLRRLERSLAALQQHVADPPALRRAVVDLLEFYADRTRRSSRAAQAFSVARAYHPPPAVMTALERALCQALEGRPELAPPVAGELWAEGSLEARRLAALLMSLIPLPARMEWVESKAQEGGAQGSLEPLAGCAVQGLLNEPERRRMRRLRGWLRQGDGLRRLALIALRSLAERGESEQLPALLRLMRGLAGAEEGRERLALADALAALAHRSPPETARWVMDGLDEGWLNPHVARAALEAFPLEQQEQIRWRLRP